MNYRLGGRHSVILMSLRKNAPYRDRVEDSGTTLIYEGHDQARDPTCLDTTVIDQPERRASGALTENGKFHKAAQDAKTQLREPEMVRVYEKLHEGIWAYNGIFKLIDSWLESDGTRFVFKFRLITVEEGDLPLQPQFSVERRRIIPTAVKLAVWKRDNARCVQCGATDELHFDHDLPWSKGGTSLTEANVQLLCARHNLQKSDTIF
ncbi:MAG: HNH endonuclease [Acidobacteriaceae bacterium]